MLQSFAMDRKESFRSSYSLPKFSVNLGQLELDLYNLLSDPATAVPVAGLHGLLGIGKTALASLFFHTRRSAYEKSSFLDKVRTKPVEEVQQQLLFDLTGTLEWDKSKYAGRIRQFITTMRVLIVVDDVSCEDSLLGLQLPAFRDEKAIKKRSKAIVTSQDWQVLQDFVASAGRVQVGALNEQDSMTLFSFHAFDGAKTNRERRELVHQLMVKDGRSHKNAEHHPNVDKVARDFENVALDIVQACAGLPLSLEVVGDYLGKKKHLYRTAELLLVYKEALHKLRYAEVLGGGKANDKLWSRFLRRYDDLDCSEREVFLDFTCFFGGVEVEESLAATTRVSVSRDAFLQQSKSGSPRISLQNLIDKSFILVKPGSQLSMHNHLLDLGRRISRERLGEKHECDRHD